MTKTCSVCQEVKSLTDFYSNGFQPTGAKSINLNVNPVKKTMIEVNLETLLVR